MNGMAVPVEYDDGETHEQFQNVYSNVHASNVKTMINGNVTKNSHRPTKTVVGVLAFVAVSMIVLVIVLVTHYTLDSKSSSSPGSTQAAPVSSAVSSSIPQSTSASPLSSLRNSIATKTKTSNAIGTSVIRPITTPETETVTSTESGSLSTFLTTFISVCNFGCPGWRCESVNDCRDPYCCNPDGYSGLSTCDDTALTCGPSPSCSLFFSGTC